MWRELEREYMPWRDYDGNEFLAGGGFWMQKQHIFLYPFYYIEYALAQMCAFQFYLEDGRGSRRGMGGLHESLSRGRKQRLLSSF